MGSIPQYVRTRSTAPDAKPSTKPAPLKLLLPVDATERSRWSIEYAVAVHGGGRPVEAHLLFVAEPIVRLEVLRFRTRDEIAAFQRQYGRWQLDDAVVPLRVAGVAATTHYREGDIAFEILDCAEQLGCDRIVLPQPHPRWMRLLGRDIVRDVLERSEAVAVTIVDRKGSALSEAELNAANAAKVS